MLVFDPRDGQWKESRTLRVADIRLHPALTFAYAVRPREHGKTLQGRSVADPRKGEPNG